MDDFFTEDNDYEIFEGSVLDSQNDFGSSSDESGDRELVYPDESGQVEPLEAVTEEVPQEEEQQEAQQESMYTIDDIYDLIQVNTAAINSQSDTIEKISADLVIASKNQNLIEFVIMGVLIMFFAGFVTYLFLRKL